MVEGRDWASILEEKFYELKAERDALRQELARKDEENERLKAAYARLVERIRFATPRSLMAVTEEEADGA